jgi:Ca2+-binding RTX toxin-like protein
VILPRHGVARMDAGHRLRLSARRAVSRTRRDDDRELSVADHRHRGGGRGQPHLRGHDHFTIADAGAALTPGTGCTAIDAHSVTCTKAGNQDVPGLLINAGDGDDSIALEGVDTDACVDAEVNAGTGDDTITTATKSGCFGGGFTIVAGEGDDLVLVTRQQYSVWGGPGDDVLIGGPGADQITCGAGADVVIGDAQDTVAADC